MLAPQLSAPPPAKIDGILVLKYRSTRCPPRGPVWARARIALGSLRGTYTRVSQTNTLSFDSTASNLAAPSALATLPEATDTPRSEAAPEITPKTMEDWGSACQ